MTIIVFSTNDEGVSVELTTEKINKALDKFNEDAENYFVEIWEEDEVKLGEIVFDYESEEDDSEKFYYFVEEENETKFSTFEELSEYILKRLKA
ncbi:hypothetical protein [Clostridium manihotivorum]|uniref:DUF1292 domain-containing protein n=1 Tax=Clostridium manihotivorum TaxID=2320868 RepID=A0A410DW49_9CLOT|nr:hypothetical protein [Clostridium manihotivorum]QAA33277.1 hypothetical protein C1I91_17395 [Clostridium manihotivorum]